MRRVQGQIAVLWVEIRWIKGVLNFSLEDPKGSWVMKGKGRRQPSVKES